MKVDVECYYVRDQHKAWGYFTLFKRGVSAFTDYGCFGFTFNPGDGTSKEFLSNLTDTDYILRKVCNRDWLDRDKTERSFRRELLKLRREQNLTKERVRELYDDMQNQDAEELARWGMGERDLAYEDCYEWVVYDFPPEARAFAERLFPVFREELRKELAHTIGRVKQKGAHYE